MAEHRYTDSIDRRLCVAPMMDWTDRHCRVLHRHIAPDSLLFTEMVTAEAIIHGDLDRLLGHDPIEHPLVLQLGGSQPERLARAVEIASGWGFAEINLNVGCPSDRVQSGRFGACLMAEPQLVAACCAAMQEAGNLPITVKCRIGIDDMDPESGLDAFVDTVAEAGVRVFYLHARKAWLSGLSPRENREIPPLDYARAERLARRRDDLAVILNGGLTSAEMAARVSPAFAGVMLGRAAYRTPYVLAETAKALFGTALPCRGRVAELMAGYAESMTAQGTPLHSITRHMLGLYAGLPGARHWRRQLGEEARHATDPGGFIRDASARCQSLAGVLAA